MSDLFHVKVPEAFIRQVFEVIRSAAQHKFQILTKRADRLERVLSRLDVPPNAWLGVSVETDAFYARIRHLQRVSANVRFLSCEPLLGPLNDLPLDGIDWVIVGGESGPGARKVDGSWIRAIREQCRKSGVPFFFKQWGGFNKKKSGRLLDGRTWDEMPSVRPMQTNTVAKPA